MYGLLAVCGRSGTGANELPNAAFMDQHLTSASSTIFRSVHSLIYIFDAESPDLTGSDTHYFLKCLEIGRAHV